MSTWHDTPYHSAVYANDVVALLGILKKNANNDADAERSIDTSIENTPRQLSTARSLPSQDDIFPSERGEIGVASAASLGNSMIENGIDAVDKITILPRSGYLGGYTKLNPDEDIVSSGLISKKLLLTKIEIALAGRAAEIIVFGKNEITQCSINDISYATNLVREMVTKYGFSIIGPLCLDNSNDILIGDGFVSRKSIIADNTNSKIDNEIIKISKISLNNATDIISNNRILLDKLVEILMNEETLDNNLFRKITFGLLKK